MSIKYKLLAVLSAGLLASGVQAAERADLKSDMKQFLSQKSSQERSEIYKNFHSRKPNRINAPFSQESMRLMQSRGIKSAQPKIQAIEELTSVPTDLTVPGEYEELDAVVVTWPYYAVTEENGEYVAVSLLFDGIGEKYDYTTSQYELVECVSIPDVYDDSDMAPLFLNMVDGIQKHAEVWMTVANLEDTTDIKAYAEQYGKPLTNVKFIHHNNNSFWYRDCGPVAFYYDNLDKVGLIDFEYYPGRPVDDMVPDVVAEFGNFPLLRSTIEYEGGNILVDGKDVLFTSTMLSVTNADDAGQYYLDYDAGTIYQLEKTPLTMQQCKDSLINVMNLKDIHVMPTFVNDGGTGHIDLYVDNLDENTFVFSQFPSQMSGQPDYTTARNNIDAMLKIISQNGVAYNANYIPFPRKDNGTWYTNAADYEKYTRTYSNHLVVNNAIIQPVFNDGTTGDVTNDNLSLEKIQAAYPGYEIIPVDMRAFDGYGGSIHCITKQIPAANPIRIFHRPLTSADVLSGVAPVVAEIKSNKEISSAKVFYRTAGETEFKTLDMALENGNYAASLPVETLEDGTIAETEYYISATCDASGKTITKPFVAPKAYFTISGDESGVEDLTVSTDMQLYPNPAVGSMYAKFNVPAGDYSVKILDISGAVRYSNTVPNAVAGEQVISLNSALLPNGTYLLTIIDANGKPQTSNFVVSK